MILVYYMIFDPSVNALLIKDFQHEAPIPETFQYAGLVLGPLAQIIGSVGMLQRKNWGRLLYVFSAAIVLMIVFALPNFDLKRALLPAALFIVMSLLLYRPNANAYFKTNAP